MANETWDRVIQYFTYSHLPADKQEVSKLCFNLAVEVTSLLVNTNNPAEVTVGLRKLLEAKDCFVRAKL